MLKKAAVWGTLAGCGFLLGGVAVAMEMPPQSEPAEQFRRIEQPIASKVAVSLGGLGLMGLELWWFLLSKPKPR